MDFSKLKEVYLVGMLDIFVESGHCMIDPEMFTMYQQTIIQTQLS